MEYGAIYSDGRGVVFRSGRLGSSAGRYLMHTGTTDEPLVKDKHVAPDVVSPHWGSEGFPRRSSGFAGWGKRCWRIGGS